MNDENAASESPQLLTLPETAALLRTPVATLRYWRSRRIGPAGFRLGRRVVFRRDDVDRWVAERQQSEKAGRRAQQVG